MPRSSAENKYWEALERIQSGHTHIVDVNDAGFRISNISVALEAGKSNPKGYIRQQRYPELCDAIKAANADRLTSLSRPKNVSGKSEVEKRQAINARYKELRESYEKLLEQYLNVVKENFELKTMLESDRNRNIASRFDHR